MELKKKVKWTLLGILGMGILLFLTLVIHIGIMVYHKGPLPFEHVQMARIDFLKPLDTIQAHQAELNIKAQKGVSKAYLNTKDQNIVYTFDNRQNNSAQIYNVAINRLGIAAKPYTVSAKDLENGCPVMNNHSFYGKLTAVISDVVN